LLSKPSKGSIRDPVRVVNIARHIHWPNLHRTRLSGTGSVLPSLSDHRVKPGFHVSVRAHGEVIVAVTLKKMIRELHMIEASMRSALAKLGHSILIEVIGRAQPGFKVRLTDECSVVTRLT
jgi:hypothetical protein